MPHVEGRQTPLGLLETARGLLLVSEDNPNPKYDLGDQDEVWFMIDTDQWGSTIAQMRQEVAQYRDWFVAQSNPCFEVWLYYHLADAVPGFPDLPISRNWKRHLNDAFGGFNCHKQPIYLEKAIANARNNYSGAPGLPVPGDTEVFLLGEKILPLLKTDLDLGLKAVSERD